MTSGSTTAAAPRRPRAMASSSRRNVPSPASIFDATALTVAAPRYARRKGVNALGAPLSGSTMGSSAPTTIRISGSPLNRPAREIHDKYVTVDAQADALGRFAQLNSHGHDRLLFSLVRYCFANASGSLS